MKYELSIICTLLILISVTLIFSCSKISKTENIDKLGYEKMQTYYKDVDKFSTGSQRRVNPYQFYFTCANSWGDDNIPPSQGLAVEVDVKKLRIGSATLKSYWIAITARYINADGDLIRDWTQFGYASDKWGVFPAFFRYRWNLTKNTGGGQAPPTIIYSGVNIPLEINTTSRFEIKNIEGTTWWTFSRGGQEAFRADLEITSFNGGHEACTESWGSPDFGPALMTYYMDWYKDGQWSHVSTGVTNSTTWGINGQVQRPEFSQSQFIIGGNTSLPENTTWLWFPN
jgi:hypothetical protein